MQARSLQSEPPKDSVTELTIPVIGVTLIINECCESCGARPHFKLNVIDEDTGEVFKTLGSDDLNDLLTRQHQLTLGFTE